MPFFDLCDALQLLVVGTFLFTDGDVPNFDDAEEEELLVEELNDVGDEENFKSFQQIAEQSTFVRKRGILLFAV